MLTVVTVPAAKQDIREAALWYDTRKPGLGKQFTSAVRSKVAFLSRNPEAVSTRYDDVKTAILETFPFMIHYHVNETAGQLIIYAVLHTSRNPGVWPSKTQ
jgi:plasmid stabilization system protein ParE